MDTLKFGFVKDENNLKLKEVFKNNLKLKEIHIDIYQENPLATNTKPFMLLLRTIEKNMVVLNDDNRFILKKNVDRFETYFMNVLFSEITECNYDISDGYLEFIFKIQNVFYRITVFN